MTVIRSLHHVGGTCCTSQGIHSRCRPFGRQLGQRLLMRHIKKFPEERDRDEKFDVAIVPWRIGLEGRNDYVGVYIWEGSMMSVLLLFPSQS